MCESRAMYMYCVGQLPASMIRLHEWPRETIYIEVRYVVIRDTYTFHRWFMYYLSMGQLFKINSLAPGRCGSNFESIIFKHIVQSSRLGSHHEIAPSWMTGNFTHEKSSLVQVTVWWHQATSHYLNHCWPISISPHGIIRPQWVNNDILYGTIPYHWVKHGFDCKHWFNINDLISI